MHGWISEILIKESPVESESQYTLIERMMWRKEIAPVARTGIDMTHHDKKPTLLQAEITVHIDQRIITHLGLYFCILLHCILGKLRYVLWSIVLCEVSHVRTEMHVQDSGYTEIQIEV